jgi:hypothetical protein
MGDDMRKVYLKREFKPEKERWYPRRERLIEQMGERRYLDEVLNPFRQIMGNEFPSSKDREWDAILLVYSPTMGPDSLLEEWEWDGSAHGRALPSVRPAVKSTR